MNPFSILEDLIDWFLYWRFNICLLAGLALAVLSALALPDGTLESIAIGFWLIAGIAGGLAWQARS